MKRLFLAGLIGAGIMVLASCGGQQQQQQAVVEEDTTSVEDLIPRDRTIYGICGESSAMNTLELLTDAGDTLSLNIIRAMEAGQVFGGFEAGDRIAVLPNKEKTAATMVVNLSVLLGDWVMPNPLDGSSEVGIRIKEGGIAESIDQGSIIYLTWRLFNGQLEILSVREGGGDQEELNLYKILALGPDTLAYKTITQNREEEETFEYSRWKEKPQVDLHGLELEEAENFLNDI